MSSMQQWIENAGAQGAGVVVVTLNNELLGAVVVRDVLQPGAPEAVRALQAKGIDVWLCSGDQKSTTKAVAAELGIKYWMGECMPQDKARHVAELASKCSVGFVGDGVNDAIALGAATLGVAIGAGAHVTVDAADVVLVRSAFEDFLGFVQLSRITLRTIRMNYVWAFAFNIIGLPLAAGVLYPRVHMPPVAAGAAMAGSSLMVVLNSLRLRSTGGLWSRPAVRGKPDAERPRGCCIWRSR
jgi:Cu+-exporting ATPase